MATKNKDQKDTVRGFSSSIDEATATELVRNAYSRERLVLHQRVIIALSGSLFLCIFGIILLAMKPVHSTYFATGCDGRIISMTPLDKPMSSNSELTTWVTNAVTGTFSFDFANYRASMMRARDNYTTQGWSAFEDAMKESGILQTVIDNKYVATAVPREAPTMVKEGNASDGRHAWKFQIPMVITYQSAKNNTSQDVMVTVTVVREDQSTNPRGVGIAQLLMQ